MNEPTLRFVVLHHTNIPEPHFDLMIETSPGSNLATWRSPCWPIDEPTELEKLRDHRRDYLEFEGQITGDRGTVTRISRGHCVAAGEASYLLPDVVIARPKAVWIATKK